MNYHCINSCINVIIIFMLTCVQSNAICPHIYHLYQTTYCVFSRLSVYYLSSISWSLRRGLRYHPGLTRPACQTRQYRVNDNILYRVKSFNISDTSSSTSLNLQNYFSTSRQKSYIKPRIHNMQEDAAYSWTIFVLILNDAANQKQEKNKLLTKTSIVTVLLDHSCIAEQYSRLDWY